MLELYLSVFVEERIIHRIGAIIKVHRNSVHYRFFRENRISTRLVKSEPGDTRIQQISQLKTKQTDLCFFFSGRSKVQYVSNVLSEIFTVLGDSCKRDKTFTRPINCPNLQGSRHKSFVISIFLTMRIQFPTVIILQNYLKSPKISLFVDDHCKFQILLS